MQPHPATIKTTIQEQERASTVQWKKIEHDIDATLLQKTRSFISATLLRKAIKTIAIDNRNTNVLKQKLN